MVVKVYLRAAPGCWSPINRLTHRFVTSIRSSLVVGGGCANPCSRESFLSVLTAGAAGNVMGIANNIIDVTRRTRSPDVIELAPGFRIVRVAAHVHTIRETPFEPGQRLSDVGDPA